jgi:hypothetical protein
VKEELEKKMDALWNIQDERAAPKRLHFPTPVDVPSIPTKPALLASRPSLFRRIAAKFLSIMGAEPDYYPEDPVEIIKKLRHELSMATYTWLAFQNTPPPLSPTENREDIINTLRAKVVESARCLDEFVAYHSGVVLREEVIAFKEKLAQEHEREMQVELPKRLALLEEELQMIEHHALQEKLVAIQLENHIRSEEALLTMAGVLLEDRERLETSLRKVQERQYLSRFVLRVPASEIRAAQNDGSHHEQLQLVENLAQGLSNGSCFHCSPDHKDDSAQLATSPLCYCSTLAPPKHKAAEGLTSLVAKKPKHDSNGSDNITKFPTSLPVKEVLGLEVASVVSDGNCGFRALAKGYPEFDDENQWLEVRKRMAEYLATHRAIYMADVWSGFRPVRLGVAKGEDSASTFTQLYDNLYGRFKANPTIGLDITTWFDSSFHSALAANSLHAIVAHMGSPTNKLIHLHLPQELNVVRSKAAKKEYNVRILRDLSIPILGFVAVSPLHFNRIAFKDCKELREKLVCGLERSENQEKFVLVFELEQYA